MFRLSKRINAMISIGLSLLMLNPSISMAVSSSYRVEAGDELTISVPIQGSLSDLSRLSISLPLQIVGESVFSYHRVTVAYDGFISLPGVSAPIKIDGLTLEEAERMIAVKLRMPGRVTLELTKATSLAYFVWGEVREPGRYPFTHPTTVMEALSYAGGPTTNAKLKKVSILRDGSPYRQVDLSFKTINETGFKPLQLQPGDTIVIPRRWTADSYAVLVFLTAISTLTGIYVATKD